ncbi:hypothetical protein BLNAU_18989 [Blattamonas nauphoetae]|uniref:Uncharacterized protein n=1 Tax=Blattamonas nauphoetae TaxID=2049346 RepID=A0ABQ9X2T1_9EUKA|nr:hypothetical protein BLNAU_18989 [Blattamonas nauphoetae]
MVGISPNVNESDSTKSVGSRLKQTKSIGRLLPPTNPALEWVTHPTSKTDETLPIALSTLARDLFYGFTGFCLC